MDAINKNILLAGEIVAKKWRVAEKIGEGTFSQIYSAFCIEGDEKVAIKVEAPSALKPVLEWESTILKSLQKCPYVCRYHYHGKHAESTVLVMELLGDSMSMLRVSPDSIHGVPVSKCVGVGIEMLDAIEAFHKHGYVHRDIKASNFALSAPKPGVVARRRYLLIDFGLSRQHLAEGNVIPARPVAEFRGTSMYASLSAHRRQELGPKDDLWSWFYLVLDFMRGELPWATDAQQKNRQTVFSLKEYYTEKHPGLLVEGLPGGSHLLAIIKYLQGLRYEDTPDYNLLRDRLRRAAAGSEGEDTIELWDALNSDRERALQWTLRATDALQKDADSNVLETLQAVAKKYNTFFDCEELNEDEHMAVQEAVFELETKLKEKAQKFAPPPIQSFKRRQESEQKIRSDALRKRRERDMQIRLSIEQKLRRQSSVGATGSPANDIGSGNATPTRIVESVAQIPVHKSEDSSMELSDNEQTPKTAIPPIKSTPTPVPPKSTPSLTATKSTPSTNTPVVVATPQPRGPPQLRGPPQPRGPPPPPPPPGSFPRSLPPHMTAPNFRPPQPPAHPRPIPPGGVPPFRPPPPPPRPMMPIQSQPSPRQTPPERSSSNGFHRNGNGNNNSHRITRSRSRSRTRSPDRRNQRRRRSRSRTPSRSRSRSRSSRSQSRSRSRSRSPRRSRERSRYSRGRSRSSSRSPSRSKFRRSSSGSHYDEKYRNSDHYRSSPRDDRGRYGSRGGR